MRITTLLIAIIISLIAILYTYFRFTIYKYEKEIEVVKTSKKYPMKISTDISHSSLKMDGYDIHYYTSGEKKKELIIFLHPAFADHRCFDQQLDYFSNDYRVVTIDLLGHGLSKVDQAKDKIDASVNHIDLIMHKEGYEKAHFIGVSMGTLVAQYYGLKHPEKVASMTILGGYDINADNKEITRAQRSENIKWIFKALFSMNSFRKYVSSVSVYKSEGQAKFYEMTKHFTRKSFMVMSGLGKIIQPREKVKITYPLLIMSGDQDLELARRMSIKWHQSEPSSTFYMIKDAGHCANMDKPEVFNQIVSNFIKAHKVF